MARTDETRIRTPHVPARAALPNMLAGRRLACFLFSFLALLALTAGPGTPSRAAGKPSEGEPADLSPQEALERFRTMSPEERLRRAEKVVRGGQAFIPVTRADLNVTIVERGSLAAAEVSDIICRVKASTARSTVATTIKWVIDDGTFVKKGQRLVELDDSGLRARLRRQHLTLVKATADKAIAEESFKIVEKQSQLDIRTAAINLKFARLALKKFTGKDADEREILELKVEQAQLSLETVKLQSKARAVLAETQAKMKTTIEDQEAKQQRDLETQLAACVLKAPLAGLAVYQIPEGSRFGGGSPIVTSGEPVREGQKLLSVSSLERFTVTCRVHEALIAQVRVGQPATVRVDAFPGRVLRGRVKSVAAVAAPLDFLTADVKVYPVVVDLTGQLPGLKPGMSAEVRFEVERRPKVLLVPVASVLRRGRETFCYVKVGKGLQERKVKTGARNDFSVEVKDGLKEAELVLRSPQAVARQSARPAAKGSRKSPDARAPRPAQILVRSVRLPPASSIGRRTRINSFGLTYQDLERISALPDLTEVVPVRSFPVEARGRERMHLGRLIATVPGYRDLAGVRLASGRFLDDEDDGRMKNVAVLGANAAEHLFLGEDPVGEVVRLGRACTAFLVVGVLREQERPVGGLRADEVNGGVYIPLRTCKGRFGERIALRRAGAFTVEAVPLTEILVAARSPGQVPFIAACIAALLKESHLRRDWDVRTAPVSRQGKS